MIEVYFWAFILFLLIYEPIYGYIDFQKFKRNIKAGENGNERVKYYVRIMIGLWVPTLFILALVAFTDLSFKQIGFTMPTIHTDPLGPLASYLLLGLGVLYVILVMYCIIGFKFSPKIRKDIINKKAEELKTSAAAPILPVSLNEKKVWNYVSLTAGVTEEIIYRGFLIFVLVFLFPQVSIWVIILLASLLFGVAHTYQGLWQGVIRTSLVGALFSALYIIIDSIILLMILHFLVDYLAKLDDENDIKAKTA
ncbi:CPBP family intramembrane metalloprotease [Bacillus spizizenii]|nr:CPBP family intramembrane metalloprotease [Bacillus spizizenii]